MDCDSCKNTVQAYLDGELEGDKFAEFEHHLERCPDCRAELDRLVKMRGLLKDLKEVEVPSGEREAFIDALRNRIEAEQARGGIARRQINWRPALVAAIVIVALMIVVVFLPKTWGSSKIAPAPGLNAIEDARLDLLITSGLGSHIVATQGDFLADPAVTGGQVVDIWRVMKDTHGDLLAPAD
jgi:anti-sigma factor RsiW